MKLSGTGQDDQEQVKDHQEQVQNEVEASPQTSLEKDYFREMNSMTMDDKSR